MLSIRFSRIGKNNYPYFRIIVVDKRKDPWGKFLENLGNYNPRTKAITLNQDRVKYWIGQGAQPSASINNLLINQGVITGKKQRVSRLSKRRKDRIAAKTAKEEKNIEAPKTEAPPAEEPKA